MTREELNRAAEWLDFPLTIKQCLDRVNPNDITVTTRPIPGTANPRSHRDTTSISYDMHLNRNKLLYHAQYEKWFYDRYCAFCSGLNDGQELTRTLTTNWNGVFTS